MDKDSVGVRIGIKAAEASKQLKNLNSDSKKLEKNLHNIGNELKYAFNTSAIIGFARLIKNITKTLTNATQKQTDYIESLHLLQTAYGSVKNSGTELVKTMSDLSGLDPAILTKSLGKYRQLSSALGIASESANLMSENLLKMQNDIASLYDMQPEEIGKKLMSALTGETEAIKILGADVTQTALQQKAYNLGIQESITNMSQAEKTILRYLAIQDQLKNSQGDYAHTINSVANQTKIWNSQLSILSRQLGAVFIPILQTMLPILNGILMAINTIISTLLGFMGIDASVSSISEEFLTLKDGIEGASNAAKEANKSLRGFDKLNVIKTPKSGSAAGVGIGGVNSKLLAQMKEYNDMLDEANSKAHAVRDAILSWFGYTKDTNGVLQFSGKLVDKIKIGFTVAAIMLGALMPVLKLIKSMSGIFAGLGGLSKLSKTTDKIPTVGKTFKKFEVPKPSAIIKGLKDVALIIGGLTLIVGAYDLLVNKTGFDRFVEDGIDTLVMLFVGIAKITLPLAAITGLAYILTKIDGKSLAKGFGEIALIIGGTTILIGAIGGLTKMAGIESISIGVDTLVKVFVGIAKIIVPLGLLTGLSALTGIGSEVIIPGLGILATIIGATTGVVTALGALITEFPSIDTWIDKGIDTLVKVFEGIGRMFGAFVGGFAGGIIEGIASSLPKVGTYLSEFVTNGKDFFAAINNIDESAALGAKYLAEAILYISAANVLNGVTILFSTLGAIKTFKMIVTFGTAMRKFQEALGDNFDAKTVQSAANAGKALAEMTQALPSSGSFVQKWFTGQKDLGNLTKYLPTFGENMAKFYNHIKDVKPEVIEASANAGKALAGIYDNLPKQDGWWQAIFGEKSLATFSGDLVTFGANFKDYYENISGISIDTINTVTTSLKTIIDCLNTVKDSNLGKTARNFGDDLGDLATGIKKLFESSISKSDASKIAGTFGASIGTAIATGIKNKLKVTNIKLTDTTGKLATNLGSYSIKAYAGGGFPERGNLFIANDVPEMVGTINNKPAVANNDQIVEAISSGVVRAMMSVPKTRDRVIIEATGDTKGLLDFIDFKQKEKDRQYGL